MTSRLADSKKDLVKKIEKEFPRIYKAEQYADLILEGKKLRAVDRKQAKKRRFFLESGIVSASIFHSGYSRLKLLDRLKSADKTIAVSSTRRHPGFAFNHSLILSWVNYERYFLYQHILKDQRVKKIVCDSLRLSVQSPLTTIQKKMEQGDPYQQVDTYKKIYEKIKRCVIPNVNYMWLGVVALPADLYYLSDLSQRLLRNVK